MEEKITFWRKQAAQRFDKQRDRQERYYQKQANKLYSKTVKNLNHGSTSFRSSYSFPEESLRRVQDRLPEGVEIQQKRVLLHRTYDPDYTLVQISFTD